jgi:hypothetical protein
MVATLGHSLHEGRDKEEGRGRGRNAAQVLLARVARVASAEEAAIRVFDGEYLTAVEARHVYA